MDQCVTGHNLHVIQAAYGCCVESQLDSPVCISGGSGCDATWLPLNFTCQEIFTSFILPAINLGNWYIHFLPFNLYLVMKHNLKNRNNVNANSSNNLFFLFRWISVWRDIKIIFYKQDMGVVSSHNLTHRFVFPVDQVVMRHDFLWISLAGIHSTLSLHQLITWVLDMLVSSLVVMKGNMKNWNNVNANYSTNFFLFFSGDSVSDEI